MSVCVCLHFYAYSDHTVRLEDEKEMNIFQGTHFIHRTISKCNLCRLLAPQTLTLSSMSKYFKDRKNFY